MQFRQLLSLRKKPISKIVERGNWIRELTGRMIKTGLVKTTQLIGRIIRTRSAEIDQTEILT